MRRENLMAKVRKLEERKCRLSFGFAGDMKNVPDILWVTIRVNKHVSVNGTGETLDEAFYSAAEHYERGHRKL